jgi:hypothetical protein
MRLNPQKQTRTSQVQQLPQRPQVPQGPQRPAPPDVPQTQEELDALAAKRTELKAQLESVTDRREELADQLEDADAAGRPGLEARIQMLDAQSVLLEQEIINADGAIAAGVASGLVSESQGEQVITVETPGDEGVSREVLATAMLAEAFAFVLLGVFFYRRVLRRARELFGGGADSRRLDQLQNSVDAIAVEIERISEGQRYVTKALHEGFTSPASAEAGDEVLVRRKNS